MRGDQNPLLQLLDKDIRENSYPPAILARVVFLKYIQMGFYAREAGKLKYDADDNHTEIRIVDGIGQNEETPEKNPVIVLSRGPLVPLDKTMGNNMVEMNLNLDQSKHVDLLITTMNFSCKSRQLLEAEYIASIVFGMIRYFRGDIRQRGIADVRGYRMNPVISDPFSAQSSKIEGYKVDVSCEVRLYDAWTKRWKTDSEMAEWAERTGHDMRGDRVPPVTVEDTSVVIDND